MGAVVATNVAKAGPVSTTERVIDAWSHATPTARRATVLAAGTSPIIGAMAPATWPMRAGISIAATVLVLAALVDLRERRLPNRLVAAALTAALFGAAVAGASPLTRALSGMALAGVLMLGARLRGGVGMGDVKAAAVVGAASGALDVRLALVAIAVACGAAGAVGIVRRRASLPLGPALWFGWAVAAAAASMGLMAR